jgi:hypothetical protein
MYNLLRYSEITQRRKDMRTENQKPSKFNFRSDHLKREKIRPVENHPKPSIKKPEPNGQTKPKPPNPPKPKGPQKSG